jgi:hypothetical protein
LILTKRGIILRYGLSDHGGVFLHVSKEE